MFVELPAFARHRVDYLTDAAFGDLQADLMANPEAGDVNQGTGGLRKMRRPDETPQEGKRGGLRVIYYWWAVGAQFWLFTLYGKGAKDDLGAKEKAVLRQMLDMELEARAMR